MATMLTDLYDLLLHVITTLPSLWQVAVLGCGTSALASIWLRRYVPALRGSGAQVAAMFVGFVLMLVLEPSRTGAAVSVFVGLLGPWIGTIGLAAIEHRWPFIKDAIEK